MVESMIFVAEPVPKNLQKVKVNDNYLELLLIYNIGRQATSRTPTMSVPSTFGNSVKCTKCGAAPAITGTQFCTSCTNDM